MLLCVCHKNGNISSHLLFEKHEVKHRMTTLDERTLKTTNRKLETYLYSLGIKACSSKMLWDGMVEWTYANTEEFRSAFQLYKNAKVLLYRKKQNMQN